MAERINYLLHVPVSSVEKMETFLEENPDITLIPSIQEGGVIKDEAWHQEFLELEDLVNRSHQLVNQEFNEKTIRNFAHYISNLRKDNTIEEYFPPYPTSIKIIQRLLSDSVEAYRPFTHRPLQEGVNKYLQNDEALTPRAIRLLIKAHGFSGKILSLEELSEQENLKVNSVKNNLKRANHYVLRKLAPEYFANSAKPISIGRTGRHEISSRNTRDH